MADSENKFAGVFADLVPGGNPGKQLLNQTISDMRSEYGRLKQQGGAISSKQGLLDNVVNWGAAKTGEAIGNPTASEAESTRQTIRNMRQGLVSAIMAASGMSARQVDSNVELQNLLNAATDPTQSLETVNRTLDSLMKRYGNPAATSVRMAPQPSAGGAGGWGKARVKGQ